MYYDARDGGQYDGGWKSDEWGEPGFGYETPIGEGDPEGEDPIRRRNIEFTMKVLKGKNKDEITRIFLDKHGIAGGDLDTYNKAMKRVDYSKHNVLFWTLPLLIINIAFFFTLIAAGIEADAEFPKIFNVVEPAFYERFVNMMYGLFLFCGSFFLAMFSIRKMSKAYKWSFI